MTISSVSGGASAYLQQSQAATPKPQAPASQSAQQQDSVQLSSQAKAAALQDVDHDGDSH